MPGARAIRNGTRFDQIALGGCVLLALLALILPATVREPVAASLRRTLLAPMIALQEGAEIRRRALLLQEQRTAERDTLTLRALGAADIEAENERLRRIIGLGARLTWGFVPAEALHGRGVRDAFSVVLSAGSRAGAQRLSPVVTAEGLVGMVERVDPTMSQAILWTHPDFRVSAMSPDASAFGIAQAHLGSGPGRFMLELRGVPFRAVLEPGTLIISAGLGGTYPRGIPIGTVVGEIRTTEAWARTYLLRPAVMPADVNSVMILTPQRTAAGVENVWQYGTGIDPTVRAILAANDSLIREAALAEAAARRAMLDSLVADSLRRAEQAAAARGLPPPPAGPVDAPATVRPEPRPPRPQPEAEAAPPPVPTQSPPRAEPTPPAQPDTGPADTLSFRPQ